jgi:hypothetical protein
MQKSPYENDPISNKTIRIKNRLNAYRKEGQSLKALAREEIKNKSPYGKIAQQWLELKKKSRRGKRA